MLRLSELRLPLEHGSNDLQEAVLRRLRIPPDQLLEQRLVKRSIDARRRDRIQVIYSVDVAVRSEAAVLRRHRGNPRIRTAPDTRYRMVAKAPPAFPVSPEQRPVVVGAGPCGYFAALLLAQMGFRPLLLERGQPVKQRTLQTFGFWRGRLAFDPESNAQFGEGGAGTFSDGKLYSQVSDPEHYGRKVLEELVASGASDEILTLHRPHIGTFKLATVVRGLRARIEALGGEVRFASRVDQLLLESGDTEKPQQLAGIRLADGRRIPCRHLVLAPGHSARDCFAMLDGVGVQLERKPFSVGLRIEHPQPLIDQARWGEMAGHPKLGAAEYKLVHHAGNGRCVYSFCMCPGGFVVGATSEAGRVVTNGMSQHSRNERNANSGLVVNLEPEDLEPYSRKPGDPLPGWLCREISRNGPSASEEAVMPLQPSVWRISWRGGPPAASGASPRRINPASHPRISAPFCRSRLSRPSGKLCRHLRSVCRAMTTPMRCSPAWRPAPPPQCAFRVMGGWSRSTPAGWFLLERGPDMRAASSRQALTASALPRPWPVSWWGRRLPMRPERRCRSTAPPSPDRDARNGTARVPRRCRAGRGRSARS